MTDNDTARRQAIEARVQAATAGPWYRRSGPPNGEAVHWSEYGQICPMRWTDGMRPAVEARVAADADFIAHAREDVPWLLAQLEAVEAKNAQLRVEVADAAEWRVGYVEELRLRKAAEATAARYRQALEVIYTAARGDEKSECWTIRRWLDERDVFNDDLGVIDRLIAAACLAALAEPEGGGNGFRNVQPLSSSQVGQDQTLHRLRDTFSRWSRNGQTDDQETPINDYGKRVLSMVIRALAEPEGGR